MIRREQPLVPDQGVEPECGGTVLPHVPPGRGRAVPGTDSLGVGPDGLGVGPDSLGVGQYPTAVAIGILGHDSRGSESDPIGKQMDIQCSLEHCVSVRKKRHQFRQKPCALGGMPGIDNDVPGAVGNRPALRIALLPERRGVSAIVAFEYVLDYRKRLSKQAPPEPLVLIIAGERHTREGVEYLSDHSQHDHARAVVPSDRGSNSVQFLPEKLFPQAECLLAPPVQTVLNENGRDLTDFIGFCEKICSERFGIVVDIGHTRDEDGINPFTKKERARATLAQCGRYLRHLHLHDFKEGDHYAPFTGEIQWKEVFLALADVDYAGEFMFEAILPSAEEVIRMTAAVPTLLFERG